LYEAELQAGLEQLDVLSRQEYKESLSEVASVGEDQYRLDRIGRLIGVTLKEPFATIADSDAPSERTAAYRRWYLKNPEDIRNDEAALNSWQYQTLAALSRDVEVLNSLGRQPEDVYHLMADAQFEKGFFGYLATSCRKYLCSDPELREQIREQEEEAKSAGIDISSVTPKAIVASGGATLGTILVQSVPVLGFVGVPIIAGLVMIIYTTSA
jgi:hypothetical protein